MPAMKWWGWGHEGVEFSQEDKPDLAPFIADASASTSRRRTAAPVRFEELRVPEPTLPADLRAALEEAVDGKYVSTDPLDRVVHARGKSLRDLIRQRSGDLPGSRTWSCARATRTRWRPTMQAAIRADAVVIPFGGGSSISGSLEAPADETRPVISLDLERLDKVLEIDAGSRLARVQAGVFGPRLEEQLAALGYTFGHFPDSFAHSTLGGWIATRSSGMQSDRYGDIADMVKGLRVVTPVGHAGDPAGAGDVDRTERAPDGARQRGAAGDHHRGHRARPADPRAAQDPRLPVPDLRRRPGRDAGSGRERVLGVGYARLRCARDAVLVCHAQSADARGQAAVAALKAYLRRRLGFDVNQMCLSFIGYEGSERHVAAQRARSEGSSSATAGCASARAPARCTTRRSSTSPTSATFSSTAERPATCPRRRRRGAISCRSTTR